MHLEFVRKNPGYKVTLWWGKEGQLTLYIGTHTHPWFKFYFFKDPKSS